MTEPRHGVLMSDESDRATELAFGPIASAYRPCKIVLDMVLSCLLLILAAPLILALVIVVRMTSRGPAIYRQIRLGMNGLPFTIYKIRTMTHDCEKESGPRWSTREDPRVTRLGRFLRRTHLDELPQLWNILRGEMSLVGPRPERPELAAKLEEAIPDYRRRLAVRPGITGLAQVYLPPDVDLEGVRRKLVYDVYYVNKMGLVLDLRLLTSTALFLAGMPFFVSCRLLRVTRQSKIEGAYPTGSGEFTAIPQAQSA
jgi:lipopolysaccharide/colanic/teichoic acid biosynthesis glycosyltransferase